jgi:serine/threonine protein kinase
METRIIDSIHNSKNNIQTKILDHPKRLAKKRNTISFQQPKEINITENKIVQLDSYIDKNRRNIYLIKLINKGSFNDVFNFSYKKSHKYDPKYIVRINNSSSSVENINSELNGIKKQYKLCAKNEFIGQVIDYGKIYNPTKLLKYRLQEYSIQRKYGLSFSKILSKKPKYTNLNVTFQFMKNFLLAIDSIHQSGFAHLDLKPENILLKNRFTYGNGLFDNLDFVIVDFGAAYKFTNDKSKTIKEQMASAAFSPPELLQRKFGKKSDIWAYGIICYLVCVRKFFFQARADKVFMNDDLTQLKINIHNSLDRLFKNTVPKKNKTKREINKYIYPLNTRNFKVLIDYFKIIFQTDPIQRPNTGELKDHKLMEIIDL